MISFNQSEQSFISYLNDIKKPLLGGSFLYAITYPFVPKNEVKDLNLLAIGLVALTIISKKVSDSIASMPINRSNKRSSLKLPFLKTAEKIIKEIPRIFFSILDGLTRTVLTHEIGHVVAGKLLYKNISSTIEIFPLRGGITKCRNMNELTKLGHYFGHPISRGILSLGGPIAGTCQALFDLSIYHRFKTSSFGKQFKWNAITNILIHSTYALTALWDTDNSNDFLRIRKIFNIHPLVSATTIILIPTIYHLALSHLSQKQHQKETKKPVS